MPTSDVKPNVDIKPNVSSAAKTHSATAVAGAGGSKSKHSGSKPGKKYRKKKKKQSKASKAAAISSIRSITPAETASMRFKSMLKHHKKGSVYHKEPSKARAAWRPGRPYQEAYWTLGDLRANFGDVGETLDRSVLKVLSYKYTILDPSNPGLKGVDTISTLPPIGTIASAESQYLILNPQYRRPGTPRFCAAVTRKAIALGAMGPLRRAAAALNPADTAPVPRDARRNVLLGASASGYVPESSHQLLDGLTNLLDAAVASMITVFSYADRQPCRAINKLMRQAKPALINLKVHGYDSTVVLGGSGYLENTGKKKKQQMPLSAAISSEGWDMRTFPAKMYTLISPLCPARIDFGRLGCVELAAGDMVAILAANVPHALTLKPTGQRDGYVMSAWIEDRLVRLMEYEEWLNGRVAHAGGAGPGQENQHPPRPPLDTVWFNPDC